MATRRVMHRGERNDRVRALQAATNRRLRARDLGRLTVQEDGDLGARTLTAVRIAARMLGALKTTYEPIVRDGVIPVGVQRMIVNPRQRTAEQRRRGEMRVAHMRAARQQRASAANHVSPRRQVVIARAFQAADNYRANPGAYHYLAGGKANTVYLKPTPRDWRSDCSQFVAAVYKDAGLPSPGDVAHEWVNTWAIDRRGIVTHDPQPGDLGLYGPKGNPHHVELFTGRPGRMFVGHGSPPIDSVTPGLPSYYVTFPFLDG
jgi:cell wall-associated NlpC family hydrolase